MMENFKKMKDKMSGKPRPKVGKKAIMDMVVERMAMKKDKKASGQGGYMAKK